MPLKQSIEIVRRRIDDGLEKDLIERKKRILVELGIKRS